MIPRSHRIAIWLIYTPIAFGVIWGIKRVIAWGDSFGKLEGIALPFGLCAMMLFIAWLIDRRAAKRGGGN